MSPGHCISPAERRRLAALIRAAYAENPTLTVLDVAKLTGASPHVTAQIRRLLVREGRLPKGRVLQ